MARWVMVDIETSGLNPNEHEVIEVGMVDSWGDEVAFSLPFDESKADAKALEVNGWGKREFAPQMTVPAGLHRITEFLAGDHIVAAPAHFDIGFLEAEYRRMDIPIPWGHRRVLDMKSFAQGRLGSVEPLKNSAIGQLVGIDPLPESERHSALTDARWQAQVFAKLFGYVPGALTA